jgi:hypothetical protein
LEEAREVYLIIMALIAAIAIETGIPKEKENA